MVCLQSIRRLSRCEHARLTTDIRVKRMATNSGEKVFTSWKEIASFFGKGVRTVERWEQKFGLPISRPTAAKNVVLTTESELREWIRRSSSQLTADDGSSGSTSSESSIANLTERLKR